MRIASLRGQLFLFDPPRGPTYAPAQGWKLLLSCVLLEALRSFLTRILIGRHETPFRLLAEIAILTSLAYLLVTRFAEVQFSNFGLRPLAAWSKIETIYFAQIIPITLLIFFLTESTELQKLMHTLSSRPQLWTAALSVFAGQIFWGWYQELIYRGIVQTELVRRWGSTLSGSMKAILAANLLFTFGPLHFYHFAIARNHPAHLWIFAAIFSMGLYFALLFHRSSNLWITGLLHGLGDWFIDGVSQFADLVA